MLDHREGRPPPVALFGSVCCSSHSSLYQRSEIVLQQDHPTLQMVWERKRPCSHLVLKTISRSVLWEGYLVVQHSLERRKRLQRIPCSPQGSLGKGFHR